MPGFDQNVAVPPHHEPPRMDADETLPSMMHPSYPYGRGPTVAKALRGGGLNGVIGVQVGGEGLGSVGLGYGAEQDRGAGPSAERSGPHGPGGAGSSTNRDMARLFGGQGQVAARERDRWIEFGLDGVLERERKKEAPPVMAVGHLFQGYCLHAIGGYADVFRVQDDRRPLRPLLYTHSMIRYLDPNTFGTPDRGSGNAQRARRTVRATRLTRRCRMRRIRSTASSRDRHRAVCGTLAPLAATYG
jgi:hypothetical protein